MAIQIQKNTYGKHRVRVSKIRRHETDPRRHQFIEAAVDVELTGDLAAAYTDASNENIVATDTCKNTVYVLAKDDDFACIESFAVRLANHFLSQYDHLQTATVSISENRWTRIDDCDHGFTANQRDVPTTSVHADRQREILVKSGLRDFMLAKTTQSGFANFHQDEFRTLPDTSDRIMATSLTADWVYRSSSNGHAKIQPSDYVSSRVSIVDALTRSFVDHFSHSIQETLMRMGTAALEACEFVESIDLTMPNKHHILFPMQAFDRENDNEVFAVTDEPFGYIRATVGRDSPLG